MSQLQVNSYNEILKYWEQNPSLVDDRWLAYVLTTTNHESRMQPVREGFCKSNACSIRAVTRLYNQRRIKRNYALPDPRTGKSYYGRGFVQLTWPYNYKKLGHALGMGNALYLNPDLALKPEVASKILWLGMRKGHFVNGHHLPRYFNSGRNDWVGARRMINGDVRKNGPRIAREGRRYKSIFAFTDKPDTARPPQGTKTDKLELAPAMLPVNTPSVEPIPRPTSDQGAVSTTGTAPKPFNFCIDSVLPQGGLSSLVSTGLQQLLGPFSSIFSGLTSKVLQKVEKQRQELKALCEEKIPSQIKVPLETLISNMNIPAALNIPQVKPADPQTPESGTKDKETPASGTADKQKPSSSTGASKLPVILAQFVKELKPEQSKLFSGAKLDSQENIKIFRNKTELIIQKIEAISGLQVQLAQIEKGNKISLATDEIGVKIHEDLSGMHSQMNKVVDMLEKLNKTFETKK